MLIGFASSSDLPLSFLQRLELRYLILPLLFLSMISVSYGLQLRESRPPYQNRERPQVPETAAEQDATVQGLAEVELADLDAQPADIAEDEASDSTDEDYQPIPRYRSPRPHDHEAGGSGSASRSDPAMMAILERLTQAQKQHELQLQRQA
jgi:hypothetical protein